MSNQQMDIQGTRRSVLRALIKKRHDNVVRQFAIAIGKPDRQINDMLAEPPRKSFGERVARAIEKAYDLPLGFLDDASNADAYLYPSSPAKLEVMESDSEQPYLSFNSMITEVIKLMESVDENAQRDILGAARVTASEYRTNIQNSTKRAG